MKAFIGITDPEWYRFLLARGPLDEVNFWRPLGATRFRALEPGQPFLFKLPYPLHAVVGGGFFAHFSAYPASLAWEAFGEKNGAATYAQMRERIEKYRRRHGRSVGPHEDYEIGCIILVEPFFLREGEWVAPPADWGKSIVAGRTEDLTTSQGKALWEAVLGARGQAEHRGAESSAPIYGDPTLVRRRLGQGAFRVLVTDAYGRHCAVTGEKTLPVLEAAHIQPVASGGLHRLDNGLLLRSDVHTLFDRGYVTVTPDCQFRVSPRLKADWSNGQVYYELENRRVNVPEGEARPSREALEWHGDVVFRG